MNVLANVIDSSRMTSHPWLFFTPKRIDQFRKHIGREGILQDAWLKLLQRADSLLEAEFVSEEYAEGGSGQHGNYGRPSSQVQSMGATLGLAYQITADGRYAEKLREALFYYGNYKRWCGVQFTMREPPWRSELNTARFCYGYAIGYDCIYDFLSQEDRIEIAESMIRLGVLPTLDDWILPEKRVHALDSMGHNWWSVCVAMAGLAALSLLGDEPRAEDWVSRPIGKAGVIPNIERIQSSEMIGVRIHENGMVSDVYLNLRADGRRMHRNSNKSIFGWETDAYLLATTRPEDSDESDPDSIIRYFVACGSYLRKGSKVILDSLSKVYVAFTTGQTEMEVILQGQPLMEVTLRTPQKPLAAKLNHQSVDVDYNEANESVTFIVDNVSSIFTFQIKNRHL